MRNKLVFTIIFFMVGLQSYSQDFHFGIVAGANINKMKLDMQYHLNEDTENFGMMLGLKMGGFAEYLFNKHIGLQADLYYTQYGYRITNEDKADSYTLDQLQETTTNDISMSLLFKYYIFNQRLAIDLGFQPSFCVGVKRFEEENIKTAEFNLDIDTTYRLTMGDDFTPFTLGVVGGLTFYLRENLFISGRYLFGLTNLFKQDVGYIDENNQIYTKSIAFLSKNRVIQLDLGWRF